LTGVGGLRGAPLAAEFAGFAAGEGCDDFAALAAGVVKSCGENVLDGTALRTVRSCRLYEESMHSAGSAETPGEVHGSSGPPKRGPQDDNGHENGAARLSPSSIHVDPRQSVVDEVLFLCLCGEKRGWVVATLHFLGRVAMHEGGGVVSLPNNDSRYR
jgi:hypothetical protein